MAYRLLPKKNPSDINQHLAVAWNASSVTIVGEPFQLPIDTDHDEFNLLDRSAHAVKFSFGASKTDVVLLPVHLKSNRGGVARTRAQRAEEAKRIVEALPAVREHFHDDDIIILGDTNVMSAAEGAVTHFLDAGFDDLNSEDSPTTFQGSAPFDRIFTPSEQTEFVTEIEEVFALDSLMTRSTSGLCLTILWWWHP